MKRLGCSSQCRRARLAGTSPAVEDEEIEWCEFEEFSRVAVEYRHVGILDEEVPGGRSERRVDLNADQSCAGPGSGGQPSKSHTTSGARLTDEAGDHTAGQDPEKLAGLGQAEIVETDATGKIDGLTHQGWYVDPLVGQRSLRRHFARLQRSRRDAPNPSLSTRSRSSGPDSRPRWRSGGNSTSATSLPWPTANSTRCWPTAARSRTPSSVPRPASPGWCGSPAPAGTSSRASWPFPGRCASSWGVTRIRGRRSAGSPRAGGGDRRQPL
jgi:hypothetical protein